MKFLVILVIFLGLSAVLGSIVVGNLVFDGRVVEKPYETGLIYDEIERIKKNFNFQLLNQDLRLGENRVIFYLQDRQGNPVTPLKMVLSRPSTTRFDKEVPFSSLADGRYQATVEFPLPGYWDLKLKLKVEEKEILLEQRIYVGD